MAFACESSWNPAAGSALHLFIEHSPALDGDRSFLSVRLNYGILRSVRLDQENEQLTEVVIPLPPDLLKLENELSFSVEQYPAAGAAGGGIWTSVSLRSYIVIRYAWAKPNLEFRLLPAPLLDPYSYRPKSLDMLLPERVSTQTLEAIALVVANACNRVSPEPVSLNVVRSIQAATHPLLIVGTPYEQPQLQGLQRRSSFVIREAGGRMAIVPSNGGEPLTQSEGLVGLTTRDAHDPNPILFLTGSSPTGVLTAAKSLFQSASALPGGVARVSAAPEPAPHRMREWKDFMPPSSRFSLADMGWKELSISSQNDFSLALRLDATPDARFLDYAPQAVLQFRLDPALYAGDCRLEVHLNGTRLGQFHIREIAKGSHASLPMKVPAGLLKPHNALTIAFQGSLPRTGQPVASLLPSSHFYLPRDYSAEVPDLRLLQFHLYPLTLNANLSDTTILLPRMAGPAVVAALAEVASALGRMSPAGSVAFRVRRLGELARGELGSYHFVFLHAGSPEDSPEKVFPSWPRLPRNGRLRAAPVIQEVVSPWSSRKLVLAVSADSTASLGQAVKQFFSPATLRQLSGDTAFLIPRQPACFTLGRQEKIRQSSYFTHLEAWLRANWLALPVILTAVSGILFVGLRLALQYYKRR